MAHSQRPRVSSEAPPSAHFAYSARTLSVDGVSLREIAERFGTPCYVYSGARIDQAYREIDASLSEVPHLVAYAMKANSSRAILERLARAGSGVDIVSGGELARARRAGFASDRIVYSGVGKTDAEITAALEADVRALHVESPAELAVVETIARSMGRHARVVLRLNPDVDAETHPYIATGLRSSKFGIDLETARGLLPSLLRSDALVFEGVACHIGSMVSSPAPIAEAVELIARFAAECRDRGATITTIDAGGGFGIAYGDEEGAPAPYASFGRAIIDGARRGFGTLDGIMLEVEPGRAIVGDAGVLLTRVLYVKDQPERRFVVVDGAMTELVRPALYGAYHAIVPVQEPLPSTGLANADVVGPVCESSDFLAQDRPLPPLVRGDLIAIRSAGAYCSSMASQYNSRPRAAEVMVDAGVARCVRPRQPVEDLFVDELP